MNRYFHDYSEWDESAIRGRGEELFATARSIWPYPIKGDAALFASPD